MSTYFDFHYHPMFKQYLSDFEQNYPTQRDPASLTDTVRVRGIIGIFDRIALHFLGSQSSFQQMTSGGEVAGVSAIVALEYAFANAEGLPGAALRDNLVRPLDDAYFNAVCDGTISYFRLFIKELNLYSRLANIGTWKVNGQDGLINILARSKNAALNFDDITSNGRITVAMAMEGGHNLNRSLANNPPDRLDTIPQPDPYPTDAIYDDFYRNCNTLLSPAQSLTNLYQAMWQEELDLLYLTLTHLTYISELQLATHAYGMKILKHPYFKPSGSGLTDAGRSVITAAYEMTVGPRKTPILIDIKHMSLKSRLDFYAYRRAQGYTLPILATHMGVTGWTIAKWINAPGVDNHDGTTTVTAPLQAVGIENSADAATWYYFNPWTIGLMDEDIIEVLNSNGMIGLSMDKRIIGAQATEENTNYITDEYMSTAEFQYLKANFAAAPYDPIPENDPDTEVVTDPNQELSIDDRDHVREIACLAFSIIHIVAVAKAAGVAADPWQHIVMGSDYDGLIEPMSLMDYCTDLNDTGLGGARFNDIENILLDLLPTVETSYLHYHPYAPAPLLPRNGDDVDMDVLKMKISGFLHDNGVAFLKKWYTDGL